MTSTKEKYTKSQKERLRTSTAARKASLMTYRIAKALEIPVPQSPISSS